MSGPIPNLTQFLGVAPTIPRDGQSADPALDFSIPSAWENPDLWDHVIFTDPNDATRVFVLPPYGYGKATLKTPNEAQLDDKGGAGKAAPRTTKTGGKATKEKIEVKCIDEGWPYLLAAARALSEGSGPWNVSHPKFDIARITQVMIEKWEDAPDPDEHGEYTWGFHYSSVSPAAQSGAGGGNAVETPWTDGPTKNPAAVDPNQQFHPVQEQAKKP